MSATNKKPSFSATFPVSASVIGDFRKVFGPCVEPVYVSENGAEVGRKPDESRFKVIAGKDLIVNPPKKAGHGR